MGRHNLQQVDGLLAQVGSHGVGIGGLLLAQQVQGLALAQGAEEYRMAKVRRRGGDHRQLLDFSQRQSAGDALQVIHQCAMGNPHPLGLPGAA
ncbi:hypothetical protein D3C81_1122120 [compost metagenome]